MQFHPAHAGPLWFVPLAVAFVIAIGGTIALSYAARGHHRFLSYPRFGRPPGEDAPALPAFLGGAAIVVALAAAAGSFGMLHDARYLLIMMCLMFAVGLWSSVAHTPEGVEIAVQVLVTAMLAHYAGIEFRNAGDLFGLGPLNLGILALPVTVVILVVVAHSLTMMDDLEGFRAAFAFTALAWLTAAGAASGMEPQSRVALLLEAALAGYLLCSVLLRSRRSAARVFLGPAGGLMIGFALGWLGMSLTQGPGRSVPPIAALFFVLLPVADGLSVALRQFERGRNPFERGDYRIHHYLFSRGFSSAQTLVILVAASALLGAVGYFGWRLGVPEPALFWLALFGFLAYHAWIKEAWRKLKGVYFVI
jgi:UDP-GlcNAc:undecaprenyl-phosphate GlcNAc-1-phosphate transferase